MLSVSLSGMSASRIFTLKRGSMMAQADAFTILLAELTISGHVQICPQGALF
jgi:hypothetical protein